MAYLENVRKRRATESRPLTPLGASQNRSASSASAGSTDDALSEHQSPRWEGLTLPSFEASLSVLIGLGALLLWEFSIYANWMSALFFPPPTVILETTVDLTLNGDLLVDLGMTLQRFCIGLSIGGGSGLLLGFLMGWFTPFRRLCDPFISAAHPLPKISILPIIMIIFGIGEASKIVIVAIAAFFPMLINTMAGVRQIDPLYFDVATHYGANPLTVLRRVVIPGSLPMVLTGLRLALNSALVLTIAVELLTAREGLGAVVWLAWETLRTEQLYAALLVMALLGINFNQLVERLTRWFIPWQVKV